MGHKSIPQWADLKSHILEDKNPVIKSYRIFFYVVMNNRKCIKMS